MRKNVSAHIILLPPYWVKTSPLFFPPSIYFPSPTLKCSSQNPAFKRPQFSTDVCLSVHRCICVENKTNLMSLNALLHLWYPKHVSDTSIPIIRSSRLYVCYYCLWCALHTMQHLSSWTHSLMPCTWPPTTSNQALNIIVSKNTHIASSSWWWA